MDTDNSPARQTLLDSGSAEQAATPNPLQHVSFSAAEYAAAAEGTSSNFDTPQVRSSKGLDLLWLCHSPLFINMRCWGYVVRLSWASQWPFRALRCRLSAVMASLVGLPGSPHCNAQRQGTLLLLDTLRAACAHEC